MLVGVVVTTLAVCLNRFLSGFMHDDRIGNITHGKHISVTQPILSFKSVMFEDVILWNMAVIAGGMLTMGAVKPGGILWTHHMAIDACLG